MTDNSTLFPENPSHGAIFELRNGLYFQFDATLKSWVKVASNTLRLSSATATRDGTMSATDYKKLNRLVLAPPFSSLIGNDCVAPFKGGNITLASGDKFLGVDGNVTIRNIGSKGEVVSKSQPFKIHQNTYGFDFTIDLPLLVAELKRRGQFNVTGKQGKQGNQGEVGDAGPDYILSGPPGDVGSDGSAPDCAISVEPDALQATPHEGLTKALVGVSVVKDEVDPLKYKLVFDRQTVGIEGSYSDKMYVRGDSSPWILAVAGNEAVNTSTNVTTLVGEGNCDLQQVGGTNTVQPVFYIDIEPIVDAVHQEFIREVGILKKGYEDIVKYWIQTMSNLFDQQKAALCCALQYCLSATKSTSLRQHMESVAASAAGSANILLHGRDSNQAVELSSTRLLKEVGGPDLCRGGPHFPQYPTPGGGPVSPPPPPTTPSALAEALAVSNEAVDTATVTVDPSLNSSALTGVQVPLKAGDYTVVIDSLTAQVDQEHRGNVKIQHVKNDGHKTVQFLDRGSFASLKQAQEAYHGLSLSFRHDGGLASFWLPSDQPQLSSGSILMAIMPASDVPPQEMIPVPVIEPDEVIEKNVAPSGCEMALSRLAWYQRSWDMGNCCGLVVNVMGQDYIIVKRSIGNDLGCGGGESEDSPCVKEFMKTVGHPAFAWPTFDGRKFAPLPNKESVAFHFDEQLNQLVTDKITAGDFTNGKGSPAGIRHLSYQLTVVLFPAS